MRLWGVIFVFVLLGAGCSGQDVVVTDVDSLEFPERAERSEVAEGDNGFEEDIVIRREDDSVELLSSVHVMKSTNFAFEPNELRVKSGEQVTVEFTENVGVHSFVIDAVNVRHPITSGSSVTFISPSIPGEYEIYCDVGEHKILGMHGMLVVE